MTAAEIKSLISGKFAGIIREDGEDPNPFIVIDSGRWATLARWMKAEKKLLLDSLHCVTGYDPGAEQALEVRYNLFSMTHRHWLEIRIAVDREEPQVPSVEKIWRTADWQEREIYDMYGIRFIGHRDLRRILLEDDWEGWPLRKDYVTPRTYRGMTVPKDKR